MIPLICPSANLRDLAEEIASNLGINLIIGKQPTDQPYLYFSEAGLSFLFGIQGDSKRYLYLEYFLLKFL